MPDAAQPAIGSRRPRHDPRQTEQEILDAAEQLLREQRFRDVTVEEVMRRTGLKRPAFYAHFRDRHDLVLRVVGRIGDELFAMANRWLEGGRSQAELRAALEGLAAVYVDHAPVLRAVADATGSDAQVETGYRTLIEAFVDATTRHLREQQAAGRLAMAIDAEETARALVWLIERYFYEAFGRAPQTEASKVVDVLERIWLATLYGDSPESV